MAWWMAVAAGVQIASGVLANQEAKKTAGAAANLIRLETKEELRRMDRTQLFRMGSANATIGTSGGLATGSSLNALKQLELEYGRQRQWTENVGKQRAVAARLGSNYVGKAQVLQGAGQMATAFGGMSGPQNTGKVSSGPQAQSQAQPFVNYNQRIS